MPYIDACPLKKTPFDHQLSAWRRTRDKPFWGRLWEQGTGKSGETIMEAAWLYSRGEIDGHLILAPNGVHSNWITDEYREFWPDELGEPSLCFFRSGGTHETKWHRRELERCIRHKGFAVLAMSYDALDTEDKPKKPPLRLEDIPGGKSWAKRFLVERRAFLTADESSRLKTPTSRRTILACKAALHAQRRRILNGTPVPNGPFDIYAQICFLDPVIGPRNHLQGKFWLSKGITSYEGFKAQFGQWQTGYCWRVNKRTGQREKKKFPELVAYKNLDLLNQWLSEITDRVLKEDVLDLPPKLYKTMRFEMTGKQRRVYEQLEQESLAFLSSGELVTAPLVLTKMIRLQQVACGYVAVDNPDDEPIIDVDDKNPRLDLLMEICEDIGHKAIIWACYTRDVDLITAEMTKRGFTWVRYDGEVDENGRLEAKQKFKTSDAQFFVAKPSCAGEGLTLLGDQSEGADESLACKTVIYYSNGLNLQHRLQSEDRAHRIGQRWPVQYIDLVASDTIDLNVLGSLRAKFDVAQKVTGDRLRAWLTA